MVDPWSRLRAAPLVSGAAVGYILDIPAAAVHLLQPGAEQADLLSERAYYRIRELIVSLELPPGSPVDERALMERLGLGRTPVREALRLLAREGLVEAYPRRGMLVSAVDAGDLSALSEVRAALEPLAARLAAGRATADERAETKALLAELRGASGAKGDRKLIELDQRIHRHVYRCAHNPFLAATLDEHYVLALRVWFLALDRLPRLEAAVQEHRALLAAIRDGDAERAESVAREHVLGFDAAIRRAL